MRSLLVHIFSSWVQVEDQVVEEDPNYCWISIRNSCPWAFCMLVGEL